jgi:hypothetical protein
MAHLLARRALVSRVKYHPVKTVSRRDVDRRSARSSPPSGMGIEKATDHSTKETTMSEQPKGLTAAQKRQLIIAVVVSDVIILGLVLYFFLFQPKSAPAPAPAAPAASTK